MRVGILALGAVTFTVATLWSNAAVALPDGCGDLVIDDALMGSTLGTQQGGTLDADGFHPGGTEPPGSIVWSLAPPITQGCVELTVTNVTTTGVGEHDLAELFTGPDGAFTDGNADYFLLLKIAGDVFPEYEGRLKIEMGLEYDALEVGTWADALPWSPADSHTLAIRLDGTGSAQIFRDDVEVATVDYTPIAGGALAFESLRIPNDGEYQVAPPLNAAVFRNVRVYDVAPDPPGTTGPADTTAGDDDPGGAEGSTSVADGTAGGDTAVTDDGSTSGDVGTGAASGPGLPLPGQRPSEGGCACRAQLRGAGAPWGLLALAVLWRRRRR